MCTKHFEDSQFMNPKKKDAGLVWNAVPTLFDIPNKPKPVTLKRKAPARLPLTQKSKQQKTEDGGNADAKQTEKTLSNGKYYIWFKFSLLLFSN